MKIQNCIKFLFLSTALIPATGFAEVKVLDDIPFEGVCNTNYASNKAPLTPQRLIKLPVGSIAPKGWILTQLQLQQHGLCGELGNISAWLQKENNAWLNEKGEWGWEEVPYWLRGFSNMAYILNDKEKIEESKFWIEAILKSQREDGNFGPVVMRSKGQDLWPNMLALWILQDYYEFTNDERVLDFMTKYFNYQMTLKDEVFLKDYWENSRAGDNLWSVAWLYNRTGNTELLKLAEKLHKNTADWTRPQALPNWHNVNIAQCFREPAIYYLFNGKKEMLNASYAVQRHIRRAFGQVPGGMFGADENARMGYFDPRQGTETCGFAEQMASDEIMMMISGDDFWAENCEDIAFNSYPAAFTPDYRALRYITSPNMVLSDTENHSPGIQNAGPFLAMNPFSSRCCQHNHGFAWPYYNNHLMFATPDNGLAVLMYNSCEVNAKVADGVEVTVKETTNYPFGSDIAFEITPKKKAEFPFYLRIPAWTKEATVKVNGENVETAPVEGKYLCINRKWSKGDRIEVNLPMHISMRTWAVNKNSVSVDYGPLTLSLEIQEKLEKKNSAKTAIGDSQWQKTANPDEWPTTNIFPASAWNYALCTDAPITMKEARAVKEGETPFTLENVPFVFTAKGRLIPSWTIDQYGLCGVLPEPEASQSEEVYDIRLVPMGAARLRISAFPQAEK